ncbi:MAG: hypothetical protein KKA79_03165 [Nanoarchaeota archaeon]|nr:hypothetical protein [Nanoarchaeota archaeon]
MKLPKTFRPEKDLDGRIEDLLSSESLDYNPRLVNALLCVGGKFLEHEWKNYDAFYDISEGLVRGLEYGLKDVEELSKRIKLETEKHRKLGIYLSALVNKIITENDVVTLNLEEELDGIGMYLQKGKLIVEGNAYDYTGCGMEGGKLIVEGNVHDATGISMKGGELVVKGNAYDYTGCDMEGGKIVVEGNANDYTGSCMSGGELVVEGKIGSISNSFRNGVIIEGGKTRRDC